MIRVIRVQVMVRVRLRFRIWVRFEVWVIMGLRNRIWIMVRG